MYFPTIVEKKNGQEFHWDPLSRLLNDRIVMLTGEVNEVTMLSITSQLLYLNNESHEEITLIINSPGGSVYDGLQLYDTINMIEAPVKTICMGLAASMGAFLLSSGVKGRRFASKSSRIMIHGVSSGTHGVIHDMEIDMKETKFLHDYLCTKIAEHCNQKVQKVKKDVNRDFWMSAEQALKYGLIDGIV